MARRLPTKLQISHAENFFCARNPPCDALDELDLDGVMDRTLTFKENLEALKTEYPQYNWAEKVEVGPRSYEKEIVADARAQVSDFSYDILKKSKIESLQIAEGGSKRLQRKLETCEALPKQKPPRPGTCRIKTVEVSAHRRCMPRRR